MCGFSPLYTNRELSVSRGDFLTADLWNKIAKMFHEQLGMSDSDAPYVEADVDDVKALHFTRVENALNACIETYQEGSLPGALWETSDYRNGRTFDAGDIEEEE